LSAGGFEDADGRAASAAVSVSFEPISRWAKTAANTTPNTAMMPKPILVSLPMTSSSSRNSLWH
jgi:hypothetical protein